MLRRPLPAWLFLGTDAALGAHGVACRRASSSTAAGALMLQAPSLSQRSSRRSCLSAFAATPSALGTPLRSIHTVTTAANFDVEVIQSQQAICVVYYIPNNSGCSAYLKTAEKLVDALNAEAADVLDDVQHAADTNADAVGVAVDEAAGLVASNQPKGTVIQVDLGGGGHKENGKGVTRKKTNNWLKLCTINADENRNLASAFSVERAKLPMTYFIMQGTIVDKVVGHISEVRLRGILYNFLAHYQKQMNVDLMAKSAARYGASGGSASPLPSAEKADLLQAGASSQYIKDKIYSSLVGSDMIALPEEAEHLDGLRTLVQDGKKKAHAELQDLYKQLGMDVRRLSDSEMHKHYYQSQQFTTMAVVSALEALFLAREFAYLGDISKDNVEWARRAVQKDFEPILGHHEMRKVLALVDANTLRGELQLSQRTVTIEMQSIMSSLQAMQANEGEGSSGSSSGGAELSSHSSLTLQQRFQSLQRQHDFSEKLLRIIGENIDARVLEAAFPSAIVDELFEDLKTHMKESRTAAQQQQSIRTGSMAGAAGEKSGHVSASRKEPRLVGAAADERVQQLKTVIMCILQLYPADAKSQMARARLSSLLF